MPRDGAELWVGQSTTSPHEAKVRPVEVVGELDEPLHEDALAAWAGSWLPGTTAADFDDGGRCQRACTAVWMENAGDVAVSPRYSP